MKTGARSVHEHRVLSKALQWGVEIDGINVKNCASFEYLCRRKLLLEDAHKLDPDNPNWEGAHHWMGEDDAGGGALGSGAEALRSHVAQEFAKDYAVAKERRKAMEARKAKAGSGG
jgi:hypothetical protein